MTLPIPLTVQDVIDSVVRVAVEPRKICTNRAPDGTEYYTYEPGLLEPIAKAVAQELRDDPLLRQSFIDALVKQMPVTANKVAQVLSEAFVYERAEAYGRKTVDIAKWAEPAVKEAFAEALKPSVAQYVRTRFGDSVEVREITINVTLEATRNDDRP